MNIEELKILALAATAGPWFNDSKNSPDDVSIWAGDINHSGAKFLGNIGDSRIREIGVAFDIETNNGNYISAANPLVIIELIGRLQAAESKVAQLNHALQGCKGNFSSVVATYADERKLLVSRYETAESKLAELEKWDFVAEIKVWNKGGSGEFKECVGIDKLNDGDRLYLCTKPVLADKLLIDQRFNDPIGWKLNKEELLKLSMEWYCLSTKRWPELWEDESGDTDETLVQRWIGFCFARQTQIPNWQPITTLPQDNPKRVIMVLADYTDETKSIEFCTVDSLEGFNQYTYWAEPITLPLGLSEWCSCNDCKEVSEYFTKTN